MKSSVTEVAAFKPKAGFHEGNGQFVDWYQSGENPMR